MSTGVIETELSRISDIVILRRSHEDYDSARRLFNSAIDRRPLCIWRCTTSSHVTRAIEFARKHSLPVTIRGGGHNVAGLAIADDGVMIDLSRATRVSFEKDHWRVSVEGGATWADVDAATAPFSMAVPGGTVPSTGVGGLTLGGGVGWLAGYAGLSCDHLVGVELVTAAGKTEHVTLDTDPDLIWALRGGGGNFGVVTNFHFATVSTPVVLAASIRIQQRDISSTLRRFAEIEGHLPHAVTSSFTFATIDSGEKSAVLDLVCTAKSQAAASVAIAAFTEAVGVAYPNQLLRGYVAAQNMLMPTFVEPRRCYWRSCYVSKVDDDFAGHLVDAYLESPSPHSVIILEHLHGAYRDIPVGGSAFAHRHQRFNLAIAAQWITGLDDDRNRKWCRSTFERIRPFSARASYVNYVDTEQGVAPLHLYDEVSLAKLRKVKTRLDPGNVFRTNHNIFPFPSVEDPQ